MIKEMHTDNPIPHLIKKYDSIIDDGNLDYYYELKENYKDNERVVFLHY